MKLIEEEESKSESIEIEQNHDKKGNVQEKIQHIKELWNNGYSKEEIEDRKSESDKKQPERNTIGGKNDEKCFPVRLY